LTLGVFAAGDDEDIGVGGPAGHSLTTEPPGSEGPIMVSARSKRMVSGDMA
jgi:hypothetical protein